MNNQINIRKYIFVFLLTCFIFLTAFYISNYINNKKAKNIKFTEDKISVDILSLETQFELLQDASCKVLGGSTLSDDLDNLGEKLTYAENQNVIDDLDFQTLKKYYSILEIKDYLLMKKMDKRCSKNAVSIIYFYSIEDCGDCKRQGYILTDLREKYPELRVYTFDYNLDSSAVKTLISLNKVPNKLPALIMNDKVFSGLYTKEKIEEILSIKKAETK